MTVAAIGRLLDSDTERMNKTEAKYAAHLELMKRAGEIDDWRFEAVKFRLAPKTFYTPDFLVILEPLGEIDFHEVKGFLRDDAAVKFKVAREAFPWFGWKMLRWTRHGWEEINL